MKLPAKVNVAGYVGVRAAGVLSETGMAMARVIHEMDGTQEV